MTETNGKNNNDILDSWKEMMCTKMQKSLSHCETPDGIIFMGNECRGKCRYSHYPLKSDVPRDINGMLKPFAVRKYDEMKEVLMNSEDEGPDTYYYMIRGGKEKTNVTVWESGTVGGEYIKTFGHYHVGKIDETYWIVSGEGIVLLQQRKIGKDGKPIDDEIDIFDAIRVKAGDYVHIPPGMGHLAVNTGKTWLVTIDNSPISFVDLAGHPKHADYEPVRRMHGFAYYVIDDGGIPKLIKNTNYSAVPEPKWH